MYPDITNFCNKYAWDYNPATKENHPFWLSPGNPTVRGGEIQIREIDVMSQYPQVDMVSVMGLNQPAFEYLMKTYGKQLRAICFWKNPLVKDWTLLGTLPKLEFVYYFFNQRITSFWNMSRNISLKGIYIQDFSRLTTLNNIQTAPNLERLEIRTGNKKWEGDILKYLVGTKISHFSFHEKTKETPDLSYLKDLKSLKVFDFPSNLFTTEQVAWMVGNYPHLTGCCLGYRAEQTYSILEKGNYSEYVQIVGKRKPMLKITENKVPIQANIQKMQKYEERFRQLVECCKGKTYSEFRQ